MTHASLLFAPAGGRTRLLRQRVPYPFHVTLPFHMDPALPDLATLYLQSSSGGLYRADDLSLSIATQPGARAVVTTQAATLARDTRGGEATLRTALRIAPGSVLLYAPDPLVLFPGAALRSTTEITLPDDAAALCLDGFACHDPAGGNRPPRRLETAIVLRNPAGRVLMADRGVVDGAALGTPASPLGPYRAAGTMLLLHAALADPPGLAAALHAAGCAAATATLPNGAGIAVRLLAPDGGRLATGLAAAFAAGFRALFGCNPAPRRK